MFKRPSRLYTPVCPVLANNMRNARHHQKQYQDKCRNDDKDEDEDEPTILLQSKRKSKELSIEQAHASAAKHQAVLESAYSSERMMTNNTEEVLVEKNVDESGTVHGENSASGTKKKQTQSTLASFFSKAK